MLEPRVVAVDWSGRAGSDQKKTIYIAEVSDGTLLRLENGRTRDEVVEFVVQLAADDPNLVVGFDFAFSLPEWYLRTLGITSARELWSRLASASLTPQMRRSGLVEWMRAPEPPFWSTRKADSALQPGQEFRRTELELRGPGVRPKSVFQLVGAGQVGRGSLYGMQALYRLAEAGFSVWPFDRPRLPLVLEIFPRVFAGSLKRNDRRARRSFLTSFGIERVNDAGDSEDAFDATISAFAISDAAHAGKIGELTAEPDYALEGRIWGSPSCP